MHHLWWNSQHPHFNPAIPSPVICPARTPAQAPNDEFTSYSPQHCSYKTGNTLICHSNYSASIPWKTMPQRSLRYIVTWKKRSKVQWAEGKGQGPPFSFDSENEWGTSVSKLTLRTKGPLKKKKIEFWTVYFFLWKGFCRCGGRDTKAQS